MKPIIICIFGLLLNSLSTTAQNTFEFWLEYPVSKWTANAVEDDQGIFIAIVSEMTGVEYSPSDPTIAYLLKISPNGDTLTKHYQYGDTLFNFTNITKTGHGGYLITGYSKLQNSDELYLLLMEVDDSLNPIWVRHHDLSGYFQVGIRSFYPTDNGYILVGAICNFPCAGLYPFFLRIDESGNIRHFNIYPDNATSDFEYLMSRDSSRIWLFSCGGLYPINGPSRAVFDTSFNYLYSESLNTSETGAGLFTVLWHSDSSFLLSFRGHRPGAPYQDDELFIRSYDTLLNTLHSNYFGAADTNDYPAWVRSIDFINPDSIFFAGWKNNEIGYPSPNHVSWIMTGQVDAELQPRYLNFIGGDSDYEINYILAAKDGGSLICANRFDFENVVYDLLFLKLNSEGLIVGNKPPGILLKRALVWPNPVCDLLYVQTALRNAKLTIYSHDGSLVSLQSLTSLIEEIDVTHLATGLYIYTILTSDGYRENGKFLKK